MDPSSKEECERAAHESLQRSEGTGGDLSVLSTRREELSANSCSHNVIFVFRKLELSPGCDRGRGNVRSAATAVHQAMKLLPGLDAIGVCFIFHDGVGR